MKKANTYQLKAGDTLQSIAKELGIPEYELCAFHNTHACSKDFILWGIGIPPHTRELIVPAISPSQSSIDNWVDLGIQGDFYCDFKNFNHDYGIVLLYDKGNSKTRFHYTTSIGCEKEHGFVYNLILHKGQTYVNYKEPILLAESLADALGKPLYPVELKTGRAGRILSIENQELVLKRWQQALPNLKKYFKSEIAENCIEVANRAYQNKLAIERAVKRDLFFALYFSGLYGKYFRLLRKENKLILPLYPFITGITYEVNQTIKPYLNKRKNIEMHQQGKVKDPRSSKDIKLEKDFPFYKDSAPLDGEVDIVYEFCKKTHTLKSMKGNITLLLEKELVRNIYIEAYCLT